MGRIRSLVSKDLLHASRENILIYVLVFPLVFAVFLRLFLPSLENMEITFALDRSVPSEMARRLEEYGRVEHFDSVEEVKQRVSKFDDVPGIYHNGDKYVVVLEGNEDDHVKGLPGAIIDYLSDGSLSVGTRTVSMGSRASMAREYGAILLAITCVAMGGLAIGLSIVDDRESRTLRALSVAPVRTGAYLAGKSVFGLSSSFVLALASMAIILGGGVDYLRLIPAVAVALTWGLATGFIMGYVCANQLTAIALLKLLAMALLGIPFAAVFVPKRFMWVLYPFPNYWSFEAMRRVLVEPGMSATAPNLLALLLSAGLLAVVLPPVSRKFHM